MSLSKDNFLHLIAAEIEETYGVTIPEHTEKEELIYLLSRSFFGIYQKKLYVYFISGHAVDYRVHHFIFNGKIR
ncbi:hypothetical protein FY557_08135 [Chryseobacterium sp. SN22]|uniref:hypothetical protein n=1 Tax=Chryseobacterium sp. SN22 TaxID=2606431 RepID=UPI0011EFBB7B|nr:hypothetical protein [Chryseobacterium sp. SN22]KAA0128540.1 hypothetical protein FY557_08135 [Chryseobacterium sp. SN22]